MISLKEGGYYNRAALIRMRKSLQRIRTLHEMKFIAMQCIAFAFWKHFSSYSYLDSEMESE